MRNKRSKILALILSLGFVVPNNINVVASELDEDVEQSLINKEDVNTPKEIEVEDIEIEEDIEEAENLRDEDKENSKQLENIEETEDVIKEGWEEKDGEKIYYKAGEIVTGWKKIEGNWYYFDDLGKMISNQTLEINGKNYRFDTFGVMITGWYQDRDMNWYYYASSGAMITGWQKVDEKWYYLNPSGRMATGWKKVENDWYYLNPSGRMATGWKRINNEWYYLKSNGAMVTGNYTIDGILNVFSSKGRWEGSWRKNKSGWWFKDPSGNYPNNQWKSINNHWYYFDGAGYMSTGWQKIKSQWYYLNPNGSMTIGWKKVDNKWYYLNSNGKMATGWKEIDDHWYYLKSDGSMTIGNYKIGGVTNVFSPSGVWQGSWQKNYKGWWYRYPDNNYPKNEWKYINNEWYHFDQFGYMSTGWQKIDNKRYYLKSSGLMVTGEYNIGGNLHIFSSSGVWQGNWRKNSKGWWYRYPDGTYPKNEWAHINNKLYYFNSSGYMSIGWEKLNNEWYYFNNSGSMVTGLHKVNNKWYFFKEDGTMLAEKKTKFTVSSYNNTLNEVVNIQLTKKPQTDSLSGWKDADRKDVEYYLNPENFLQHKSYQFLKLSGTSNISLAELNDELKGKGILAGQGKAFLNGGKKYNINEIYLLAHAMLETGHGTSALAKGVLVDTVNGKPVQPKVVYNMFGIGAYDSNPLKFGSERAYEEGWFTPEKAIEGGAKWIAGNYINHPIYQQDTLYKMRWNPKNPGVHQYATDVGWAYKQTRVMDLIAEISERNNSIVLHFDIPVYSK